MSDINVIARMVSQMLAVAEISKPVVPQRFNPRPAGQMQEGGATKDVLEFLRANPKKYFTHVQLVEATGRTAKSVDWGLLFLREQALIECSPDLKRNPRYLRYTISIQRTSNE